MWLARNKDGRLYLYTSRPVRYRFEWETENLIDRLEIETTRFPGVTWESEPLEVSIVPSIKVVCG